MLISAILGATLGMLVQTVGLAVYFRSSIDGPFDLAAWTTLAWTVGNTFAPGYGIYAILLSFVLVRKRRQGWPHRKLRWLALTVGSLLGFISILVANLLLALQVGGGIFAILPSLAELGIGILGGLALGFGCLLGLPRKEAAAG